MQVGVVHEDKQTILARRMNLSHPCFSHAVIGEEGLNPYEMFSHHVGMNTDLSNLASLVLFPRWYLQDGGGTRVF